MLVSVNYLFAIVLPGINNLECDSTDMVNENFGEMYKTSEESINSMEGGFDVNMQYKVGALRVGA